MPDSPEDILRRIPVAGSVIAGAERIGRQIEGHERLPIPLYIAELFLFLIIAVYFMQLAVLGMGITSDYGDVVISVATYIIDMIMIIATVDAVLGISSKKPSSWRKVMRGALLLFVFSIIGAVLGSASATGLVTLSPLFVTVVCIPIAAIMMLKSVRRYYVPPMLEMPSAGRWLGFVLFTQLFPAREYEIDYE